MKVVPSTSAMRREKGKGTKVGALHFRLMYKAGAGTGLRAMRR